MTKKTILALALAAVLGGGTTYGLVTLTPPTNDGVGYCPEGAVNILASNYEIDDPGLPLAGAETGGEECVVDLLVERRDRFAASGWVWVDEITYVAWASNLLPAHSIMWRIGQCGVIVRGPGGWESPGQFYPGDTLRVTALRQPPCSSLAEDEFRASARVQK